MTSIISNMSVLIDNSILLLQDQLVFTIKYIIDTTTYVQTETVVSLPKYESYFAAFFCDMNHGIIVAQQATELKLEALKISILKYNY